MEDFIGILLCLLIMIPVVVVCTREIDKQPDTEPDDIFVSASECKNELCKRSLEELRKAKKALIAIKPLAVAIINNDDKPACVYESDCPLNGGSGFDNHCDMHCPFILAKIISDTIDEVFDV